MARKSTRPLASDNWAFGGANTGVFIDGAFGMDHAVEVMCGLLRVVIRSLGRKGSEDETAETLLAEYDNEELAEEDYGEWLDEATEVLEAHTAPGLSWIWEAGDLILTDEE